MMNNQNQTQGGLSTNANNANNANSTTNNGTGAGGDGRTPSQADSPFDLSSFIAFPTANSIGHLPAGNDDLYRAFAQGIKAGEGGAAGGAAGAGYSQQQQQQTGGGASSSRPLTATATTTGTGNGGGGGVGGAGAGVGQSGTGGKGQGQGGSDQGSARSSGAGLGGNNNNNNNNNLSPYGLDPAAFHGEVRFQLPAFLNPTNSRPAYPNGAEAWSGYGNNSTKALEGMYNQSMGTGGAGNQGRNAGNSNSGGGGGAGMNGLGGNFGNPGGQMFGGSMNGGVGAGAGGWTNPSNSAGGPNKHGMSGQSGVVGGGMNTPGGGMNLGDGHNDAGGFDHWDNWNFTVDGSKPFMPSNFGGFDNNTNNNSNSMVQSPYTISSMPNMPQQSLRQGQGGPQAGGSSSNGNNNNNNNAVSNRNMGPGSMDISMPTSALLPNSAFPNSSAFASSSRMNFGQDVIRNQQGNLSANGNMYMGEEANAFPSASNDMMASGAASLIASNGLSNLVQPGTLATQTPGGPNMPGLYSTTGFDIVSVLAKVANRKDPKTVLGPVDCSCSFVVSDVRKFDCPIVYTSPTFSQLTGYDAREILGRNCRFLQSPDGEVAKGSRRKYTDNVAVAHMKRLLQAGKECQASLINYRKGGTPFINLVTVVPITWDSDEVVYHVGFQVDLVEQPNAILRNMRDGSYQVNYTVQNNPQPPLKPAAKPAPEPLPPSSIGISQEMLRLLPPKTQTAVLAGGEEAGKSEWLRLVLANTDDFVHVLSLKGQFQYVSPSVRRVLEYEPEDLLNKHISDICHPSDIVPVMRELKDATHTPSDGRQPQAINMLFRVRRKLSGYIWLESSGRLQVESGKGRKAMVLTGRDRTLPAFCWKALDDHGGLTDTEVWAKVSLDGLVLWVTGCVGDIFGGRTNDLVGKSIYSFMAGAEDGPPGPDGHSSSLAVEKAISTSAEGLPKRGATSVRHQLIGLDGRTREVTSNFFAAGSSSAGPITPSRESPTASDDDVRSNVSSFMDDLPFQILVQIKSTPTGIQKPKSAIVHPLTENVFEEMDTTRGTSWQYELHQLKIANRKLKDDIQALRTGQKSNKSSDVEDDSKRAKAKKRKANETGPQPTTDHPTPLHQQTPGFGLAPGRVFKTWS